MSNIVVRDKFLDELDESIDDTTRQIIKAIKADRDRAEQVFLELMNLFNQGKNNPEDLRELNKAQEMVQKTTDQLQKVMTTLAKIKTGDAKVQLAMIQNADGSKSLEFNRQDLIDMLEEIPSAQDKEEKEVQNEIVADQ